MLLITKNTQTLGRNGIRSPPQELKEGQRSGSHLLVEVKEEDEKIEVKKTKKKTMIMFLNQKTNRMYQLSMRIPQNMKKKKI